MTLSIIAGPLLKGKAKSKGDAGNKGDKGGWSYWSFLQ